MRPVQGTAEDLVITQAFALIKTWLDRVDVPAVKTMFWAGYQSQHDEKLEPCPNHLACPSKAMMVEFVELHGAKLAYRVQGSEGAPLLITLHGGRGLGTSPCPLLNTFTICSAFRRLCESYSGLKGDELPIY
jgi:hypothetical protein